MGDIFVMLCLVLLKICHDSGGLIRRPHISIISFIVSVGIYIVLQSTS